MDELPLSAEGTRVATEEQDGRVHLRRVVGDRLVLDPECDTAQGFLRVITPSDALDIADSRWCARCFPRMLRP